MLFLLFAFISIISFFISAIALANNFISSKINKKNLEILKIIEKHQYNSHLFFALKIVNNKGIYFTELNEWIKEYFILFGYDLQKIFAEYKHINSSPKYFLSFIFILLKINAKINKLNKQIMELNDKIKNRLEIKQLEDEYKVNLSKKYSYIKSYINNFCTLYVDYNDNKKLMNIVNQIDESIMLVDEKIDNGEFCLSAKILFKISELVVTLFNIVNIYPIIFNIIDKEILKTISSIESFAIFDKYNEKSEFFKNHLSVFKKEIISNTDDIKNDLFKLDYDNAINKLNNTVDYTNAFYYKINMMNKIQTNFINEDSKVFQIINFFFTTLHNQTINYSLYLGEYDDLDESEQLLLKNTQKVFEKLKKEILEVSQYNKENLLFQEHLKSLIKTKSLINNSLDSVNKILTINNIYKNHKNSINKINIKIFELKNKLNNLFKWLNQHNISNTKQYFFEKTQSYFKEIDSINLKDLYPSQKIRINNINKNLSIIEDEIEVTKNTIKDIILFYKLTEQLIIYNNKFFLHNPDFKYSLKESQKAYYEDDLDLSFRLSLNILNSLSN